MNALASRPFHFPAQQPISLINLELSVIWQAKAQIHVEVYVNLPRAVSSYTTITTLRLAPFSFAFSFAPADMK